jgi:spore maturation protein CgeB
MNNHHYTFKQTTIQICMSKSSLNKQKSSKINKILFVETKNKYYNLYQSWYFPLKRNCKELINFDPRWTSLCYGKQAMNKKFLDFVKKEKPEYIFMWIRPDQFYFDTLLEIRKSLPQTKVFTFFGDDDTVFESFSRFLVLFVDYGLVVQKKFIEKYKKEGIKDIFYTTSLDTRFFKPLNEKKKYDVTFIGSPKTELAERYELIKFLKDNGINIKVFGWGWDNYPDLQEVSGGVLSSDEMIKVTNQSKIHLCLSKNNHGEKQLKGKIFEAGACKTFVLTEYCKDYLDFFKEGKELVMFKDKKELLDKIRYYLKNEDEREQIAKKAYEKIIKNYSLDSELGKIFKEIEKKDKKFKHRSLPKINKNIISLSKKDLNQNIKDIEKIIKDYDYIYFNHGKNEDLKYRTYLQAYSLIKSKKSISCCDYYLHSKHLGDYLVMRTKRAFNLLNKKDFMSILNMNQLMVTKDYFLKNIDKIKKGLNSSEIDFIDEKNTTFVSFPLVRVEKFKNNDYNTIVKISRLNFLYDLYSLKYRKKIFSLYPFALFLEVLKGKSFILKAIIKILIDKDKINKLQSFKNSK